MPVSDGGDGLMEVLLGRWGGSRVWKTVADPLGKPCRACYALLRNGKTAVVEMAQASGLWRLKRHELDALGATSYGTGQLIRDALDRGASRIIVGMGGSATNDGGAGMAMALGARLLDAKDRLIPRGAAGLKHLSRVTTNEMHPGLRNAEVIAVSDVTNPLLGRFGSARVYGPQKGATPAQVEIMDRAMAHYAAVLKRDLGKDVSRIQGSAAAGGLGAGLLAFLKAKLVPGARWVLSALDARKRIARADLVLTGEGKLDRQSFFGKAPVEIARYARRKNVPVAFLCGQMEIGLATKLKELSSPEVVILSGVGEDIDQAMGQTGQRLRVAAGQAVGDFLCSTKW